MPLTAALAGCGHMGRHHARTVHAHPDWTLAAVVDPVRPRAEEVAAHTGARVVDTVPDDVDAVIVAASTPAHLEVAVPVIARGQWCLVEKPVTSTAADATRLASPRLVVGHSERFNPAVRALGAIEPTMVMASRIGPTTARCAQSDVVTDRMIHDLDLLALWGLDLDHALVLRAAGVRRGPYWVEARVRLRLGPVDVRLFSSRLADRDQRTAILGSEQGRWDLDLLTGEATGPQGALPRLDDRDALTAQWQGFTDAVRGAPGGVTTGAEGFRALALAERIRSVLVEESCA